MMRKSYQIIAQRRLKRFKQATTLAVAITALLVLWTETDLPLAAQATDPATPSESVEQATTSIRELLETFYGFWPKLAIAAALLMIGYLVGRFSKYLIEKFFKLTSRRLSALTLLQIALYLIFGIAAVSVLAGDVRALLGSLGLLGLALSWALQAPIESFSGWVLNTFRSYYRVGDRIEVGDVYGDVYRIDILNTTVWELGGPGKSVTGAQPTGALVSFPNNEILRSKLVNYSRDFPYIWDEVTISLANETDLTYSVALIKKVVNRLVGDEMTESSTRYKDLLQYQGLNYEVEEEPQTYLSPSGTFIDCKVRYLVALRNRRRWSSMIFEEITKELQKPEHAHKVKTGYPRIETLNK